MILSILSIVLLIAAGVCAIIILVAAFKTSVGQGLLSLLVPFYILYFAFAKYLSPRKGVILGIWLGGLVGGAGLMAYNMYAATQALKGAFEAELKKSHGAIDFEGGKLRGGTFRLSDLERPAAKAEQELTLAGACAAWHDELVRAQKSMGLPTGGSKEKFLSACEKLPPEVAKCQVTSYMLAHDSCDSSQVRSSIGQVALVQRIAQP